MSEDLIRRSDAIEAIYEARRAMPLKGVFTDTMSWAIARANVIPTIEPKRGEWIVYEGGWKDLDYQPPKCKCNQCGYEEELDILNAKPTNCCSNCGADMRERKEGE